MYTTQATEIVFWDVDTQFDFLTPPDGGGKLYIRDRLDPQDPGASRIVPALERLSRYARERGILRVATGDWHRADSPEIDPDRPDFERTFPPHGIAGEQGSQKIEATRLRDPLVVPLSVDAGFAWDTARRAMRERRDIFVQKDTLCCFEGNPATEGLLDALKPNLIVVYGVALDLGVRRAVEGLLERGFRIHLVADAVHGLGSQPRDELLARWARMGVTLTSVEEVTSGAFDALAGAG